MSVFNPVLLIEEVQKRPGLYKADYPADREEKLSLWKEVGAAMYHDWGSINKATAYDRVLELQRKWRSLRDAYNRELRARRSGVRVSRRTYRYFKRMSFLGGYEGPISDGDESDGHNAVVLDPSNIDDEVIEAVEIEIKRPRKKRKRRQSYSNPPEEVEMPMFPVEIDSSSEADSDRLFLLSFLPEMRLLPLQIKMWARAQIANVMQEAVSSHYNNTRPGTSEKNCLEMKRQRQDSTESQII